MKGGSRDFAEKRLKHEKTRKTLRNCMASLLRSNIQDFVQEVPVGQMAQGTPFPCLPLFFRKRGRLNLPTVQHANQGWRISEIPETMVSTILVFMWSLGPRMQRGGRLFAHPACPFLGSGFIRIHIPLPTRTPFFVGFL